jgi:hypothetical protein
VQGKEILPSSQLQFKDFVAWNQKQALLESERSKAYWSKQLAGSSGNLIWAFNTGEKTTPGNGIIRFDFDKPLTGKVKRIAQRNNLSIGSVMMSVYLSFLHRIAAANDITILTPVSLRNHVQVENLIGPLINTLPIRVEINHQTTFHSLLRDVHKLVLQAINNSNHKIGGHWSGNGYSKDAPLLSNVGFTYHNKIKMDEQNLPFVLTPVNKEAFKVKADLWMHMMEDTDRILVTVEYKTEIFGSVFNKISDCFQQLVHLLCDDEYTSLQNIYFPENLFRKEKNTTIH